MTLTEEHRARGGLVFDADERVDPGEVVLRLPETGILSVFVEGGPTIASAFLDAGVVDEIHWYVGARLARGSGIAALHGTFATMTDATTISFDSVVRLGGDLKITAHVDQE